MKFIDEVRQEVSKVVWPTWREVWITTLMVLVLAVVAALFFLAVDQIIYWVIKTLMGIGA